MTLFEADAELEVPSRGPDAPAVRVRMLVAYDGTGFHGFAAQHGQRTVAGVLCMALERFVGHTVELVCAGRTDKGVHAWGQVIHADLVAPRRRPGEQPPQWTASELLRLQRACNKMLGSEVVVRAVDLAPVGFHARFSAIGRTYRYTILNRAVADPFRARTSWLVPDPLDLPAMRLACDPLLGEHDFASFCRRPANDGSMVRFVRRAEWRDLGDGSLRLEIEASAFCHQMVRALTGTMVDVGLGRRPAGELSWMLRARDRSVAGTLAPPHGLCLWEVEYPQELAIAELGA